MAVSKVPCWMCGEYIFADAVRCPDCGAPPPERRQREVLRQEAERKLEDRNAALEQKQKEQDRRKSRAELRAIEEARAGGNLRSLPAELQDRLAAELLITTESTPVGVVIKQRLGIVSAEKIFPTHLTGDTGEPLAEVPGTNVEDTLRSLRTARADCIHAMRREAMLAGADGVIAIRFEHGIVSPNMYLMAASGTAVKIRR